MNDLEDKPPKEHCRASCSCGPVFGLAYVHSTAQSPTELRRETI